MRALLNSLLSFIIAIGISLSPAVAVAGGSKYCESIYRTQSFQVPDSIKSRIQDEKKFYSTIINQKVIEPILDWSQLPFSKQALLILNGQIRQTRKGIKSAVIFGTNFLIPSPVPLIGKENKLLNKQLSDPDYQLTNEDLNTLGNDKTAIENFKLRGQFLKRYPWWTFIRQKSKQAVAASMALVFGLSLSQAVEMEKNTVSTKDYVTAAQVISNVPTVQVLIETTPFPHTAIRIGNKVYSYGTTHMNAVSVAEYFREEPKNLRQDNQQGLRDDAITFSRNLAARSVRVIDLRLQPNEVYKLRTQLELETAKHYKNVTGVNDCATMIARALKENSNVKIPIVLDAYPTTMGSYLTLRHLLGDDRVGNTSMIIQNTSLKRAYLARNTWIAAMEAKVMLSILPVSVSRRVYFDFTTETQDISYYDPKISEQIASWKAEVNNEILSQISSYSLTGSSDIKDLSGDQLKLILEDVINPQIEDSLQILSSTDSEFQDIILNQEKHGLLVQKKKQILEQLDSIN